MKNPIKHKKRSHDESPSIYVACLAAYNNGKLHGRWIDCTYGESHVWEEIQDILKTSPENEPDLPCEEWAIHDYEFFPRGSISEYMTVETVCGLAEVLESDEGKAILAVKSHLGLDSIEEAQSFHDDNYHGAWSSFREYAENYVDDTGLLSEVPESIRNYFDYESFARDLSFDYITEEIDGEIHIWLNV